MNTSAAVEMRNISKRFGTKVQANDNVSLDIQRGEILAALAALVERAFAQMEIGPDTYRSLKNAVMASISPADWVR